MITGTAALLAEKDAEIERLRDELRIQMETANHWFTKASNDHNRGMKLEAENATLRDKLAKENDANLGLMAENSALREAIKGNAEPASRKTIQDALIYGSPALYASPAIPEPYIWFNPYTLELSDHPRENYIALVQRDKLLAAAPKP